MKKLLYLFLLPSILFSQTTPSVTPRVDGEGSLGTETYRWGEIHTITPSVMDNSSKVPTTSWIRNYLINNTPAVLQPEVINLDNTVLENIMVNKIYAIISNYSINNIFYLPKITEDNLYSEISFHILLQSNDNYITLQPHPGDYFASLGTPDMSSYFYNLYGRGDRVTIRAVPSASAPETYCWFLVDSTDNLISKGTLYIPESVRRKESLVFSKGDYAEGKINFWWDDMDFTVSQGNVLATKYDFLAFRDLETASPYTEFVQPVKALTPAAADDSTNVATTAWVQDEIALKQNASNAMTTNTAQEVTGTKTYRTSALYYGPATPANHTPFGFGCGGVAYWGTRQYTNGTLIWQSFPTGGGSAQNALGFIFGEDGSVPNLVLYNTPTAPTAAQGTNTQQLATTEFVQAKAAGALLTEATPASSSATGTKGMIRYDSTYVYVCVATDTWIRLEKATW